MSVPTYNTLKRMTPAIVLISNRVFRLRPNPSRAVVLTIVVVVFGCLVAGYGDLEFDPLGYVMGLTSCGLQAAYMICVEKTGAEKGVSSVELMVYNALLSAPPLTMIVLCTGEFQSGLGRVLAMSGGGGGGDGNGDSDDSGFLATFVLALLAGMMLNYALFLCTITNSALTTTVVGVLKGVASTLLGFFLLGGVKHLSATHVVGIVINTCGGVAYSFLTYQEKQRKRRMTMEKVKEKNSNMGLNDLVAPITAGGGGGGGGGGEGEASVVGSSSGAGRV